MSIPTSPIAWNGCYRIVLARFPAIDLFEHASDADEFDALMTLESLTNPHIFDEVGAIHLVPREDRVFGPGSSAIMAPFTHLNPFGSRFSDGSYGVFYAGRDIETVIEETKYHVTRDMLDTEEDAMDIDMRVYMLDLKGAFHDIRGRQGDYPLVYSPEPENYHHGQHLARTLREKGTNGIAYSSVRHKGGECIAVFRPRLISNCRQERHLCYQWDGEKIRNVYEKREL